MLRLNLIIIAKTFFFCMLFIQFVNNSRAQSYNENDEVLQIAQKIILKKLRVDLNNIDDFKEDRSFVFNMPANQLRASGTETKVTDHAYAESEVHAVINPIDSNNMVLCPIRMKTGQGYTLPIYYTKDFGKTWNQSGYVPRPRDTNAVLIGGGDPVFAYDASGKLYFTWIALYKLDLYFWWELLWAYSEDGGETWQQSGNDYISSSFGTSIFPNVTIPEIADKQWMATDKSSSVYHNNLYVAYLFADIPENKTSIVLSRKKAGVNKFDNNVNISGTSFKEVQFACVSVDPYGYVHVTFYGSYDKVNYFLWHSVSKDGGNSFSTPMQITKLQKMTKIFGISTSRIYPAPYMEIDNSNSDNRGNIYLTWTTTGINQNEGNGADIYLSLSADTGQSWSTPIVVNDDPRGIHKDQFYSSIYVNPDGVISLSWYDARHSADSLNRIVHLTIAHSFDGGKTFTNNFNVSSQFSNFQTIGLLNNSFGIGEYNQLISTKGYVIPIWSDGRKGDGNLDIYVAFAEIDRNPVSITELSTVSEDVVLKRIYPVPVKKDISASFSLKKGSYVSFQIFTSDGKEVVNQQAKFMEKGDHKVTLDVSTLKSGLFVLRMMTDHDYFTRNFVIRNTGN